MSYHVIIILLLVAALEDMLIALVLNWDLGIAKKAKQKLVDQKWEVKRQNNSRVWKLAIVVQNIPRFILRFKNCGI